MRRCAVCTLLAPLVAASAAVVQGQGPLAIDTSSLPVYTVEDLQVRWTPLSTTVDTSAPLDMGGERTIYSSITGAVGGGFFAQNGDFLVDDYQGVGAPAPTGLPLRTLRFEGGVTVAGMVAFFVFFDEANVQLGGFGFQFPAFGGQLWEFVDPTPQTPVLINERGRMAVVAATANQNPSLGIPTTITWSQSPTAPSIGSNIGAPGQGQGGDASTVYSFELSVEVPAPGPVMALAAFGGLAALSRRRKTA